MAFEEDAHKALVYVEKRLWEISTLLGLPPSKMDGRAMEGLSDMPGDENSRRLARELVAAMASYLSCVEEEQCWSSETFSGLAFNIERALRDHGLKPPLPEDEEDPALSEPITGSTLKEDVRVFFEEDLYGTEFLEEIVRHQGDCDWCYVEENLSGFLEKRGKTAFSAYGCAMRILWEDHLLPLNVVMPPHILRPMPAPAVEVSAGASQREPFLHGGVGGNYVQPERSPIAWTAKTDCPHCHGTGLPCNAGGHPILYPSSMYGGGEKYNRRVCECVESEKE